MFNYIIMEYTISWLRQQIWFWILIGILIISTFFYLTKGLITIIGGFLLGIYLYHNQYLYF